MGQYYGLMKKASFLGPQATVDPRHVNKHSWYFGMRSPLLYRGSSPVLFLFHLILFEQLLFNTSRLVLVVVFGLSSFSAFMHHYENCDVL